MTWSLRTGWRLVLHSGWAGAALCLFSAALWAAPIDQPPSWRSLSPAQQQALAPLQQEWPKVDARRKQKWLEVASRYATMPRDEQTRVQARMTDWLALSPTERARARTLYQEARQVPADERQARWRAYQALSADERHRLAKESHPAPRQSVATEPPLHPRHSPAGHATVPHPVGGPARTAGKSAAAADTPPSLAVQARPGATTNALGARATPPLHQQAGLPRIAATPGFVDPATLLPKRGPQGAAMRSPRAAASASAASAAIKP